MSSNKSIAKSAGLIGIATFISRILGFVRDIIFAAFFGTGVFAQAFVVAFRIPNLLRDLIGEGAANAAIVPVLVEEYRQKGRLEFWRLAGILLNIMFGALCILTLIGMLFSKPLVIAMAPGFVPDKEKLDVTILLTRLIFPYLILIGLAAYGMGVLNSIGHFSAPAFGMALLNIGMIACMLIWKQQITGLAAGVLVGGVLQVVIQIPPLIKNGLTFREKGFVHPQVRKIVRLLIPRLFGTGIYQINLFVSTQLASIEALAGTGAVAALYYSSRLWQLPLAIFAIALAQASLPALSGHAAAKDIKKFCHTMNFLIRGVSFVLLPAAAGLIALAVPITKTLFERGAFDHYSTLITSSTLLYYSIGLLSYGAIRILVNGFYAMQDTLTPVKVAAMSLVLNIGLSLILMRPMKVGGLALANSIAGIFNALILYIALSKKTAGLGSKNIIDSLVRISIASMLMGVFVFWVNIAIANVLPAGALFSIVNLLISLFAAAVFYLAASYIIKIGELRELKEWIFRKR